MAEVFISYARTDQGFARDLNAALEKSKRATWMDWRSIPDSAQWRAEIFAAIEAADNFLFLVSPDSLRSTMCEQEVAHAVRKSKRIVTILYHQVQRKDLFPGLGEIQWINYPDLGFKRTFQKVKAAIDADLEWGKKHTQIGLRAAQWEANHRENGYLLHGSELQEAIRWLEEAPKMKVRQLTALHEKYIRASETWETGEINRLTRLTQEKERQRKKAEKASRLAVARELVVSSGQSLVEDPERSILLAMHAIAATWKWDRTTAPEAEDALHQAIELSFVRVAVRIPGSSFHCVDWSPDGTRLATGRDDGAAEIWDTASGKRVIALTAHRRPVSGVVWSPDSKLLATASADKTAKVWDVASGRKLLTIRHQAGVHSIAWSRDGKWIATGSTDVCFWNAKTGKQVRCFFRGHKPVTVVAWSNNNKSLATAELNDDTAKVWNANNGELLKTIVNKTGRVNSVAWSPDDGRLLVSGGDFLHVHPDNVARVWDVTKKRGGELFTLPPQESELTDASWSPDGDQLATATLFGGVNIWNARSGAEVIALRGHTKPVEQVVWSPGSDRVATAGGDGSVRIWHVNIDSELPMLWGHQDKITAVAWSSDSGRLATGGWDGTARVWDAATGNQRITLGRGEEGVVRAVSWSPDGKQIATASWDSDGEHVAKVWNSESGELIMTLKGHTELLSNVAWSPDGAWLVTSGWDRTARIWAAATGKQRFILSGQKGKVHAVDWSPDSKLVATGSLDGTVKVWDASTGRRLFTLPRRESGVAVIAWSPDGKKLATGELKGKARVWDLASRREIRVFSGHRDMVTALAWSPGGERLVVGGGDEMGSEMLQAKETCVRVWEFATGKQEITFSEHKDVVNSVAWSPDGKRLATASVDRTVRQYAMDIELLLQVARGRVTRNLTPEECRKYLHRKEVPPIP
jgi:WD40 repeat protein